MPRHLPSHPPLPAQEPAAAAAAAAAVVEVVEVVEVEVEVVVVLGLPGPREGCYPGLVPPPQQHLCN